MEDPSGDTIMEERKELMVPPAGGKPTYRSAHFLKPTLPSTQNHPVIFPPSSNTINPNFNLKPLKVIYQGWRRPQTGWKEWVEQLKPLYGHVWKKAGIFDAIQASTYHILKDRKKFHEDSIMKLAAKWCIETNTFMFTWGEATVTLEDIMVLGGYSVFGDLFISPLRTDEMLRMEEKLTKAQQIIRRTTGQAARESTWLHRFIGSGHENLEHEAFLTLWLSRYVFPRKYDIVEKGLFLIAIHLSKGIRIALAPAVLARIYRDLSLLKLSLEDLSNLETGKRAGGKRRELTLCGHLGLVLIWAWERFPTLSPDPNPLELGEPRLARWDGLEQLEVADIREVLDSAGENFQWRPYAPVLRNWNSKNLYKENERYIIVDPGMDSEVETLVLCWRTSELVGMDCIEQYLPHRVAMQFGFDQDLPGFVKRSNDSTAEMAWSHYNRPLREAKLYIPARLFESGVTRRYLEQWRDQSKYGEENAAGRFALPHVVQQMISDDNDDNALLPSPKDDLAVEKHSGDETLSPPMKNDDPNPNKPDDENLEGPEKSQTKNGSSEMKGKGKAVSLDKEADKSHKNDAFAGKESTEISEQISRVVPDRAIIKNQAEKLDARIRNLEKIVDHLMKKSCKRS